MDIEWAQEDGDFFITQSRPITTLASTDTSKANQTVEVIKKQNWEKDWEGAFSLLQISFGSQVYFGAPKKLFGVGLNQLFMILKDGIVSAYLQIEDYETFGSTLARQLLDDETLVDRWCKEFMKSADVLNEKLSLSVDDFFDEARRNILFDAYNTYGAYQIAIKAAVNFLPRKYYKKVEKKFEKARKYSENIYKDAETFIRQLEEHIDFEKKKLLFSATVEDVLSNNLDEKTLENRYVYGGVYWTEKGFAFLSKDEVKEIEDFWMQDFKEEGVLKGTPAYAGKVKGNVRIITDYADSDLKKGEILVTGMTDPNFVSLMKKASAIITDAGGVLSHAAIVSRELKKPCVVGTKIATQVLKDGMEVEVDAEIGVVRIVSSSDDPSLMVDGIEWYMTVTRNMSFWHQDLSNEGHFSFTKEYGIDAKLEILAIITGGTLTSAFMHHANYAQYADAVMKKVSTTEGVQELKKNYKQFAKEVFEALDKCKRNLTAENWKNFLESYTRLSAGLMITATIGRSGGELLSKKLKDLGYNESVILDLIATITYPQEHTPLFDSQLGLLEIGKKVQAGISEKEKKELLHKWLDKFGSIPANFCDDPWTESDAMSQLNNVLTKDCAKELISAE